MTILEETQKVLNQQSQKISNLQWLDVLRNHWLDGGYQPPKWCTPQTKKTSWNIAAREDDNEERDFESHWTNQLRARYTEHESDFRSGISEFEDIDMDWAAAQTISSLLENAKALLEQDKINNHLTISSLLDTIERYLIWVFPFSIARQRLWSLHFNIRGRFPEESNVLLEAHKTYTQPVQIRDLRAAYDEMMGRINRTLLDDNTNNQLQINRLKMLRRFGICLLLITFPLSKLLVNESHQALAAIKPSTPIHFIPLPDLYLPAIWTIILGYIAMGAMGAFISGLLQLRSSNVALIDYKTSKIKFHLRIILGGMMGAFTIVFLSWNILGIKIDTTGTFILAAFLSGFSERYFLKMLNITADGEVADTNKSVPSPAATNSKHT